MGQGDSLLILIVGKVASWENVDSTKWRGAATNGFCLNVDFVKKLDLKTIVGNFFKSWKEISYNLPACIFSLVYYLLELTQVEHIIQ